VPAPELAPPAAWSPPEPDTPAPEEPPTPAPLELPAELAPELPAELAPELPAELAPELPAELAPETPLEGPPAEPPLLALPLLHAPTVATSRATPAVHTPFARAGIALLSFIARPFFRLVISNLSA
jgi:hypothetical protein